MSLVLDGVECTQDVKITGKLTLGSPTQFTGVFDGVTISTNTCYYVDLGTIFYMYVNIEWTANTGADPQFHWPFSVKPVTLADCIITTTNGSNRICLSDNNHFYPTAAGGSTGGGYIVTAEIPSAGRLVMSGVYMKA